MFEENDDNELLAEGLDGIVEVMTLEEFNALREWNMISVEDGPAFLGTETCETEFNAWEGWATNPEDAVHTHVFLHTC